MAISSLNAQEFFYFLGILILSQLAQSKLSFSDPSFLH